MYRSATAAGEMLLAIRPAGGIIPSVRDDGAEGVGRAIAAAKNAHELGAWNGIRRPNDKNPVADERLDRQEYRGAYGTGGAR
jgi:hypothetical protein